MVASFSLILINQPQNFSLIVVGFGVKVVLLFFIMLFNLIVGRRSRQKISIDGRMTQNGSLRVTSEKKKPCRCVVP